MQTAGKSEVLAHSASDESLFKDLQQVVNTTPDIVSKTIASRTKQERKEISRILGHLPTVHDYRIVRGGATEKAPMSGTPRSARSNASSRNIAATPRSNATPRSAAGSQAGAAYTSNGMGPTVLAGATMAGAMSTPRNATPAMTPRNATPSMQKGQMSATNGSLTFGSTGDVDSKMNLARQEATQHHLQKLAEIGVDPTGMSAADILQIFYVRASPTSYRRMNAEAESRINVRAHTPQALDGALTRTAQQEVRRARDVPMTNVNACLDKWEIDTLAEVCRSVKHFEELKKGHISEYKHKYVHGPTKKLGALPA